MMKIGSCHNHSEFGKPKEEGLEYIPCTHVCTYACLHTCLYAGLQYIPHHVVIGNDGVVKMNYDKPSKDYMSFL